MTSTGGHFLFCLPERIRKIPISIRSQTLCTLQSLTGPLPSRRTVAMTGQSLEAAIDTMSEIFKKQPPGRCANCGAHSPSIKK